MKVEGVFYVALHGSRKQLVGRANTEENKKNKRRTRQSQNESE
jgi:hypothetical protein